MMLGALSGSGRVMRGRVAAPAFRAVADEIAANRLIFSDRRTFRADPAGPLELGSSADFPDGLDLVALEPDFALVRRFGDVFDVEGLEADAALTEAFELVLPFVDFFVADAEVAFDADFAVVRVAFLSVVFLAAVFRGCFAAACFLDEVVLARLDFVESAVFLFAAEVAFLVVAFAAIFSAFALDLREVDVDFVDVFLGFGAGLAFAAFAA